MEGVVYLINSTPKYYYMLPLHMTLLRRYATFIEHVVLATEVPEDPICVQLVKDFGVELIRLNAAQAGFLDSRAAALQQLSLSGRFRYVIPVQEDFLVDRVPDLGALVEATMMLDDSKGLIASARLMPSPGAKGLPLSSRPLWAWITSGTDQYGFSFQATLWSLEACSAWYTALSAKLEAEHPRATTLPQQRTQIETRGNFAENAAGQQFFWRFFRERQQTHIGWIRLGSWPNAVYLSPWPYRPTAIVQGRLEPWAAELGLREGVPLLKPAPVIGPIQDRGRGY